MVGQRWRLVSLVFVAQRMISLAWRISSGSMPRLEPFVIDTPAPTVGPQIARTRRLAPMWLKKRLLRPCRARRLWLPASLNGITASAPWVAITSCKRLAISASAASHETCSNSPLPFGPMRRSGWRMRSGLYTRSRNAVDLRAQLALAVRVLGVAAELDGDGSGRAVVDRHRPPARVGAVVVTGAVHSPHGSMVRESLPRAPAGSGRR